KFREDLYYRLSVLPLQWAPLRDRIEDIIPLAEKLLQRHAHKQNRKGVTLSLSAQQALLAYPWPGNVRELDNVMQRALILQVGNEILAEDLGSERTTVYSQKPDLVQAAQSIQTFSVPVERPVEARAPESHATENNDHYRATHLRVANFDPERIMVANPNYQGSPQLGSDLKQREYEIIMNTLRQERGSRKKTAERLGISPRTLRYKVARLREEGFEFTE